MPLFDPAEVAEWSGGTWGQSQPPLIRGVSTDTRTLVRENLYFALKGSNFDGHDFLNEAFRKGASGAVVARDKAPAGATQRPLLRVADPARTLRDVAAGHRRKTDPEIVAVTGSAGKSTVKEMIAQTLSRAIQVAGTRGNWNNEIGLPLSILAMEETVKVGVFEVGTNHPGELAPLCGLLRPDWGVVTNIGPVHMEFFGTVEAIAEEKATVLRSLPSDGVAVLNADGGLYDFLRAASPSRVITVSAEKDADYVCGRPRSGKKPAVIRERASGEEMELRLSIPGWHNVMNAAIAVAVARGHGMGWEQIGSALAGFSPLPMRWERKEVAGVTIVNDAYNANPLSMRAAITAFQEAVVASRKWLILGGMLELGKTEREEHIALGEFVGKGRWAGLIVVGRLGDLIADGAEKNGFGKDRLFRCRGNAEASKAAAENIMAGDAVLAKASRGIRLEEAVTGFVEIRRDPDNARCPR